MANGVYLPKRPGNSAVVINGNTYATHNGGHTKEYYKEVYERLNDVRDNKNEVLRVIDEIRNELLTGQLALGNLN